MERTHEIYQPRHRTRLLNMAEHRGMSRDKEIEGPEPTRGGEDLIVPEENETEHP